MKLVKVSVLTTPTATNMERRFSVFISSFCETTKYFGAILIRQTNAINFIGTLFILFR